MAIVVRGIDRMGGGGHSERRRQVEITNSVPIEPRLDCVLLQSA
jgi:hypothetical protein